MANDEQYSKTQLSEKQKRYKSDLMNPEKKLIFTEGLPSTGKTYMASEAMIHGIKNRDYRKGVYIRPITGYSTGFLPGELDDKMKPFSAQIDEYVGDQFFLSANEMKAKDLLEIIPADQLQGRRFRNCFVIFDEAQNIHWRQAFKILTRLGEGSKYVIIGDTSEGQKSDHILLGDSLLDYCVKTFKEKAYASVHTFYDEGDLLGDPITIEIIKTLIPDFVKKGRVTNY